MPTAYHVYVIELSRKVFTEDRKFREANPQFNGVQQCLYVGMTSKTPQFHLLANGNPKPDNLLVSPLVQIEPSGAKKALSATVGDGDRE